MSEIIISHIVNTFLTSEEQTTSLQRTKWLAPTCPLFRGPTVHDFPLHVHLNMSIGYYTKELQVQCTHTVTHYIIVFIETMLLLLLSIDHYQSRQSQEVNNNLLNL